VAGGAGGAGGELTTAVGTEVADADPAELCAVTCTRSVFAASTDLRTYVLSVAPPMSAQLPPFWSQRLHWYANVIGWLPLHVPAFAVSVCPTAAEPETVGGFVAAGFVAAACTVAVWFDAALADPSVFVAVTRTRRVKPTSALST
jgi:hypothetical protein